ncbi:MAG: hypothetical protein GC202_12065 [Alphaproteobacteria bacterium]|nr:hypothetical protein [Alphaproteobacteria bacterium]
MFSTRLGFSRTVICAAIACSAAVAALLKALGISAEIAVFYCLLPVAGATAALAARALTDMPAWTPWIVGAGWVALVQGDVFFLGAGSRLEWGDGNELFWTYFPYLAKNRDAAFLHLYAGGVGAHSFGRIGGEFFSWRIWLSGHLPLWKVAIALRFFVTSTAFAGAYLAARDIARAECRIAIAVACIFSVGYDVTATMTFLYGLSIAALPLIYWTLWCHRPTLPAIVAFVAGTCIYVTGSDPFYWLPTFWIVGVALSIVVRPRDWVACLCGAIVLSTLWVINFAPAIAAMVSFLPSSSRIAEVAAIGAWERMERLAVWSFAPIPGFNRGGWPMFAALALAFAAALRSTGPARWTAPTLLTLGLFSSMIRQMPFSTFGLGFLTTYNWYVEYGAFAFAAVATAISAEALAGDGPAREKRTVILATGVFALAVGQAGVMRYATLVDSYYRGGIARSSEIPNLVRPDWYAGPEWRAISVGGYPFANTPVNNGIATYDGTATLFAARLHHYWQAGILRGAVPLASLEVQIPPDWPFWVGSGPRRLSERADLDLLRAANVRYILSAVELYDPELHLVSAPPIGVSGGPRAPRSVFDILDAQVRNSLSTPAPIFVYELSGAAPRAYVAHKIIGVSDDMATSVLGEVARAVDAREAIMSSIRNGAFLPGTNAIKSIMFRPDGYDIELTDKSGGTVVVNTPYVPNWSARAGDQAIEIAPANVAQLAIAVPSGASSIQLVYTASR